jgi:hypothetical protein
MGKTNYLITKVIMLFLKTSIFYMKHETIIKRAVAVVAIALFISIAFYLDFVR